MLGNFFCLKLNLWLVLIVLREYSYSVIVTEILGGFHPPILALA